MTERHFLLILLVGGIVYAWFGSRIAAPFAYDPLGPRALPVFLGCLLALLSGISFFSASGTVLHLRGRVGRFALLILFYLAAFRLLGFMLATTIAVYGIARLRGCSWMQGLLTGLIVSICFYGIFHFLLQVPLPLGLIYKVLG